MKEKKKRHWIRSWRGRLGPLQMEIMHLIFRYGKDGISAGDVYEIIQDEQKLPKSSIYTVLNRLIKRNLLGRKKVNGIYQYYPLIQEKELNKFGSYEDRIGKKGAIDLIARLLQREIANNPEEIETLQKILDQEKERWKKKIANR